MDLPSIRDYSSFPKIKSLISDEILKIDINDELTKSNRECDSLIRKHLDDYFVLFDIGISVVSEIHNISKDKLYKEKEGFVFTSTTAKLCILLLSIRNLLYSGMLDGVKCLIRPFEECMDIFFACLNDKDFAEKYGNVNELYDNNAFWYKEIKSGKIDKRVSRLFDVLQVDSSSVNYYFQRRKDRGVRFSEAVHSSFNSTFSAFMSLTIDGENSESIYGKVTIAYPMQLLNLLEDINAINVLFFRCLDENMSWYFCNKDFVGERFIKYHLLSQEYNTIFNLYYEKLSKECEEIDEGLLKASEELKKAGL